MMNGKRRGADFRDKDGGKTDIILEGFSIETKIWKRPTFQAMLDDARHAEERKQKPTDIPLAVMKRSGDPDGDALVCVRLETFLEMIKPKLG